MRLAPLALVVSLTGCAGEITVAEPVEGAVPSEQVGCDVTVLQTMPFDGAVDAYYRGAVEFRLSGPDPDAEILADFDGVLTTREDGAVLVYTPTEPLAPNTTYEVTLDGCMGTPSISFTTSEVGLDVAQMADLEGATFVPDFRHARFLSGDEAANVAMSFFARPVLLGVEQVSRESLFTRLAVGTPEEEQDLCARTLEFPEADFSQAPYFSLGTGEIVFEAHEGEAALYDLHVDGTFAPDGRGIAGIRVQATADMRDFAYIAQLEPEALCSYGEILGAECEACPTDGAPLCIRLVVDNLYADIVPGTVEPVYEPDQYDYCFDEE